MAEKTKQTKSKAATLADVGREAGVSTMAVSTVINGAKSSARIAAATEKRILAAAAKLNYRPNAMARALLDRRINTIGVVNRVFDGGLNHYFMDIFAGIVDTATIEDQNTTVFAFDSWEKELQRLGQICDGRVDGLILLAPQFTKVDEGVVPTHTPSVSIHSNHPMPGIINLETDDEAGAYEMVKYMISQGHRRIMHVGGPPGLRPTVRRFEGYQRALKEAGIPFEENLCIEGSLSEVHVKPFFEKWLKAHVGQPLPDAIFCVNDASAYGCLEVLQSYGVSTPGMISVAGFDDLILSRLTAPKLTTVRQPLRQMGINAAEILLSLIREEEVDLEKSTEGGSIVYPTQLVIRDSVGKKSEQVFFVPDLYHG